MFFYLTPFRKWLPKEATVILGPPHVNSAFSSVCAPNSEIVMFRREEWLKVCRVDELYLDDMRKSKLLLRYSLCTVVETF